MGFPRSAWVLTILLILLLLLDTDVASSEQVTDTLTYVKVKKEWKYDPEPITMEDTQWVTSERVLLDRYHCDINMMVFIHSL